MISSRSSGRGDLPLGGGDGYRSILRGGGMSYGAPIAEIAGIDGERFCAEVLPSGQPVVFRGLASEWPAVRAGDALPAYLARFDIGARCDLIEAPATIGGRMDYDAAVTGSAFRANSRPLPIRWRDCRWPPRSIPDRRWRSRH